MTVCEEKTLLEQEVHSQIRKLILGIFFVSLLFVGIGCTAVSTLGIPYIDDNVASKESAVYIGKKSLMLRFFPNDSVQIVHIAISHRSRACNWNIDFGFISVFQPLPLVSEFWDQQPVLYWAHSVHATMLIYRILDLGPTTQNGLVLGIWVSKSIYLSLFVFRVCTKTKICQRN